MVPVVLRLAPALAEPVAGITRFERNRAVFVLAPLKAVRFLRVSSTGCASGPLTRSMLSEAGRPVLAKYCRYLGLTMIATPARLGASSPPTDSHNIRYDPQRGTLPCPV